MSLARLSNFAQVFFGVYRICFFIHVISVSEVYCGYYHVAGFQTVAIFMQTGDLDKSVAVVNKISDVVEDSPNKVCIWS